MQRSLRHHPVLMVVACLAAALMTMASFNAPALASSVHITSGKGTHAHPYKFKVKKNNKNVVVGSHTFTYATSGNQHFVITAQWYMTNHTTTHLFGDNSKTKLYVHYLYGCYISSHDVPEPCQRVSFYSESYFGSLDKLGNYYSCTATSKTRCSTTNWTKSSSLTWNIHGGLHSSNYKFPEWQSLISGLSVEIDGYWLYLNTAAHSPWYQAVLNT